MCLRERSRGGVGGKGRPRGPRRTHTEDTVPRAHEVLVLPLHGLPVLHVPGPPGPEGDRTMGATRHRRCGDRRAAQRGSVRKNVVRQDGAKTMGGKGGNNLTKKRMTERRSRQLAENGIDKGRIVEAGQSSNRGRGGGGSGGQAPEDDVVGADVPLGAADVESLLHLTADGCCLTGWKGGGGGEGRGPMRDHTPPPPPLFSALWWRPSVRAVEVVFRSEGVETRRDLPQLRRACREGKGFRATAGGIGHDRWSTKPPATWQVGDGERTGETAEIARGKRDRAASGRSPATGRRRRAAPGGGRWE